MGRLNREDALKRLDGEKALYLRMAGYFTGGYADYPEKIGDLIKGGDREAYVITHSLKNIAASLGAEELAARALALESLLKEGRYDSSDSVLEALLDEFGPVLSEVRQLEREEQVAEESGRDGTEWSDFPNLLQELTEAMGSFSPDVVGKALSRLEGSAALVPEDFREDLEKLKELAGEFRYLEGEELLLELKRRVLE